MLTGLALAAFASNSILCRSALGPEAIDAAGFSILRLTSGALIVLLIAAAVPPSNKVSTTKGSYLSAVLLFMYAVAFSFAFVNLNTGTGALILFGSVQATMFLAAVIEGQRPTLWECFGLAVAFCGLGYLVFPGLHAPSPGAALLMMLAGISWGVYSLRGRKSRHPAHDTSGNFLRTLPFALLLGVILFSSLQFSPKGVLLAVISGCASALGYVIWYAALQDLNAKHAALVQLAVPVLAATGGVLFLSEPVVLRLMVAAMLILGGISIAIAMSGRPGKRAARPVTSTVEPDAEKRRNDYD